MNATCQHCDSTFRDVDRNEDGSPAIESTKCAHPDCQVYLCGAFCQQLSMLCDACGQRFCLAHGDIVFDGAQYCAPCFLAMRQAVLEDSGCTVEEVSAYLRVVA